MCRIADFQENYTLRFHHSCSRCSASLAQTKFVQRKHAITACQAACDGPWQLSGSLIWFSGMLHIQMGAEYKSLLQMIMLAADVAAAAAGMWTYKAPGGRGPTQQCAARHN